MLHACCSKFICMKISVSCRKMLLSSCGQVCWISLSMTFWRAMRPSRTSNDNTKSSSFRPQRNCIHYVKTYCISEGRLTSKLIVFLLLERLCPSHLSHRRGNVHLPLWQQPNPPADLPLSWGQRVRDVEKCLALVTEWMHPRGTGAQARAGATSSGCSIGLDVSCCWTRLNSC